MVNDIDTVRNCMAHLDPCRLDYEQWLAVGMALKDAGGSAAEWETWSRRDVKRYRANECGRKFNGFRGGAGKPVGVGTLVKLCRDSGYDPCPENEPQGHELAWDAVIGPAEPPQRDALQVVRQEWIQDVELREPNGDWNPCQQLRTYLEVLFQAEERVGYVCEAWQSDPDGDGKRKWLPKKGCWDRTAGELCEALAKAREIGAVMGDATPEAGAWIRFNPLDGAGITDTNVTAYRFALVEADGMPVERQLAIYRELELPCAALVHSGGKSLHAIVRVEAPDYKEYQKRVDFLYDVCKRNGLAVDRKNKNPSRLSRMPGILRNGRKQWLVAVNVGKATWAEWTDWIAAVNDDLPEVECLADYIASPPPLADSLIDGIVRKGHKMLLSGPSKAGKSFLLLELCIAIAEGRDWLGWRCSPGRVLYVNLELDRASCYHRLADVYRAIGCSPEHAGDIDVWNLRGKAMAMTELAPRLIRRALKRKYAAVVIDPIYKVITGDENAADQMAKFCNQFDRVCCELGAAVIYCHHHSKGDQGGKRAHDRASGSGVFARDPDALLDMIELTITDARRKQMANRWDCDAMAAALDAGKPGWREACSEDDALVADKLAAWAEGNGAGDIIRSVRPDVHQAAEAASGWRVEGILREFPGFRPRRMFFRYPVHMPDDGGLLADALAEGEEPPRKTREQSTEARAMVKTSDALFAYEKAKEEADGGPVTAKDLAVWMHNSKTGETGISEQAARMRIDESGLVRNKRTGVVTQAGENDEK